MVIDRRLPLSGLLFFLCILLFEGSAQAGENRLLRVRMLPRDGYTRVCLSFLEPPRYRMTLLSGRLRLTFPAASAPPYRALRSYSDAGVRGVHVTQRGPNLQVVIGLKGGHPAVQPLFSGGPNLWIDVGPLAAGGQPPDILPGREAILSGTELFIREFTPPSAGALPFAPSDPKLLQQLFPEEGALRQFQAAEGLLYKEKGSEALEAFAPFLGRVGSVRALALYRQGEALYLMECYDAALASFRQGELLWPEFLAGAPGVVEQYADALARGGDYLAGRRLMGRLLAAFVGDPYLPALLNHLAEITARHGDREPALHIYRTVIRHFPDSVAADSARMKLADGEIFSAGRERFRPLLARYRALYEGSGSPSLRDEALFKMSLLNALYAPYGEAIADAASYERRYPRGIFLALVKKMREELVLVAYRDLHDAGDRRALLKMAEEHRDYLARSFQDPEFAPRVAQACREGRMLTAEIPLFNYLAKRPFAAQAAPFLLQRVVEDALTLGQLKLAESTGRDFLARFPGHPATPEIRELLGRLAFDRGDLKETAAQLSFLAGKGGAPHRPESAYYLGKALLAAGDQRGGERQLARFVLAAPDSLLAPDAHFERAQALAALGNLKGALEACNAGLKGARGETADRFLYRMGELHLQLKQMREAAAAWDRVVQGGRQGAWLTMAQAALADLEWRLKISGQLPFSSKK